ncbi:mycothiol synthase [Cellulosimicrobium sp. NPDC057127]|uniref:mycothiol synthase n=1 Tax=Cellulosimicrobium sp. NPDC057127 TaxID=3346026 RepID=UPI003637BBDD
METAILWHTGPLIDDDEVAQVHALAADAERTDGAAPLSEQPLLNLRTHSDDVVHLLTWRSGELAGYAQVDRRGDVASAELVVRPAHRRHGLGFHLLASAGDRAAAGSAGPDEGEEDGTSPAAGSAAASSATAGSATAGSGRPPLRVWAHGDLPAARALAARSGYVPVRELLVLERPLGGAAQHPLPVVPAGLRLRAFVPGQDDEAWVRANALAFASHPEQGRITVADLHDRVREDWFDPAGLLLLERDGSGELVGFVWTKIPVGQDDGAREGEIYVVGVVPDAQGEGLGGLLTGVGLAHLAGAGVTTAVLYVDGDNAPAVRTYERAGFTRREVHVQYAPE